MSHILHTKTVHKIALPLIGSLAACTKLNTQKPKCTLKVENFAGTKFRGFRGFRDQPRNLIPAKPLTLPIHEI